MLTRDKVILIISIIARVQPLKTWTWPKSLGLTSPNALKTFQEMKEYEFISVWNQENWIWRSVDPWFERSYCLLMHAHSLSPFGQGHPFSPKSHPTQLSQTKNPDKNLIGQKFCHRIALCWDYGLTHRLALKMSYL